MGDSKKGSTKKVPVRSTAKSRITKSKRGEMMWYQSRASRVGVMEFLSVLEHEHLMQRDSDVCNAVPYSNRPKMLSFL